MQKLSTFLILLLLISIFLGVPVKKTLAQEATATPTPSPSGPSQSDLQKQIQELQGKISELQSQEKSLSSQIKIADNQIALSELKIADAQEKIKSLKGDIEITKGKISGLETDIDKTSKAFVGRAVGVYRVGSIDAWQALLSSGDINNFFSRLKYLKIVQLYDKKNIFAAEQARVNYSNQQEILVDKKKEEEALNEKLQKFTDQLNQDKITKKKLLSETQGSEANFQKLLSQAKAQLAGFTRFTQSQGGASILSGQTKCDSWGCYYNQRDSQWGNAALNGTQYTLASDGCLVTSMAMMFTHYGYSVTPLDINSNSSNFASYYPAYLLFTISAGGKTAQRVGVSLDSALSGGDPVVVGVNAYGGTHFVVVKSGSSGSYIMNDPFLPGGHDVNFTDHYSMGSIFSIQKVVFL